MFNSRNMTMITLDDFDKTGLKHKNFKNGGMFVVYAEWCHFCKELTPLWKKLFTLTKNKNYGIGAINSEKQKQLVHMLGVSGYPTIIVMTKNGKMKEYSGPRNLETFLKKLPK